MNTCNFRNFVVTLAVPFLFTACSGIPTSDPKVSSYWQAPKRFDSDAVFDASLKSISRGDLDLVSNDRKTGIITAKKVIPVALTNIRSEIPITISIAKTGDYSSLNTTAYLKGMGTTSAYEVLIKDFYGVLFSELLIVKPEEKVVSDQPRPSEPASAAPMTAPVSAQAPERPAEPPVSSNGSTGTYLISTKEAQQRLAFLNYNVGTPDGIAGPRTISAIKKFQSANSLSPSGTMDSATTRMLVEQTNSFSIPKTN